MLGTRRAGSVPGVDTLMMRCDVCRGGGPRPHLLPGCNSPAEGEVRRARLGRVRAALLLVPVLVSCAHSQRSLPIPADLEPELARIRESAARLVAIERFSATTVHHLREVRRPGDPPILGMVALRTSWAQAGSVVFVVKRPAGGVQVLYEARAEAMKNLAWIRRLSEPRPLVGEEEEVWRAREAVLAEMADGRSCGAELDVLVLPRAPPDASFDVYPLPAPRVKVKQEVIMVRRSGHDEYSPRASLELVVTGQHRFHVSPDGRTVLEHPPISGACQVRTFDKLHGEGDFIDVTDTEVDLPNEAQLLDSAILGWSFRLVTRRGVWEVVKGDPSLVEIR